LLLHHSAPPAPVSAPPRTTSPTKTKAPPPHKKTAPVRHHRSSTGSSSSAPPASTPASGVTLISQTAGLTTYQASAGPITLNLSFSQPCWVEAWVNGTTSNPYGHVYQAGQSLTLTGSQSVEVRLGAPGYATLVANGQTLAALGPNVTDVLIQVG
jgi:cytoskeletal protein RodZ